ncbi:hypothetical protein HDU67_005835 [Dinochytrium kinnereticum]|nr:hypothetical protein HDU67_005835 [Dinochytrium kinnereticum]
MNDINGAELLKRLRKQQEILNKLQTETEELLRGIISETEPATDQQLQDGRRRFSSASAGSMLMDSCVEMAMADPHQSEYLRAEAGHSIMSFKSTESSADRPRRRRLSLMDMTTVSGFSVNSLSANVSRVSVNSSDIMSSSHQIYGGNRSRRSSLMPKAFKKLSLQLDQGTEVGQPSKSSLQTSGSQIQSRLSNQSDQVIDCEVKTNLSPPVSKCSSYAHDNAMEDVEEVMETTSQDSSEDTENSHDWRFQPFRPQTSPLKFTGGLGLKSPFKRQSVSHIKKLDIGEPGFIESIANNNAGISVKISEDINADLTHQRTISAAEEESRRESKTSNATSEKSAVTTNPSPLPPAACKTALSQHEKLEATTRVNKMKETRAFILEFYLSAMYNEFGERFQGSVQRKFHLIHIASLPRDHYWGFHPYSDVFIAIPLIVSFDFKSNMSLASIVISSFVTLDMIKNFYTRVLIGAGSLTTLDSKESLKIYMRRRLFLDLISAIPWYFIAKILGIEYPENFLLIYLIYTRNSIRIFGHNPILQQLSKKIQTRLKVGGSFMNVFLFAGLLLMFLHIHACLIFFFGKITKYSPESWNGLKYLLDQPLYSQYTWAFFNSVANTFPVTGYKPSDTLEQAATIVAVLSGAMLYAALVGTISTFSLGLDTSGRKFKEKLDEVNEFMEERKLSSDVRRRVRKYFKLKYRGKYFDKAAILSELNASLRQEIAIHNLRDLLARVPFLRREQNDGRDDAFVCRVADVLIAEYYIDGDTIFQQGEPGNDMYFIEHGTVDIVVNGNIVGALTDGAFFGEVALLDQSTRSASIRASSHTTVFRLSKTDFGLILDDFKDVEKKMRQVYEERLEKIRKEKEEKEKTMASAAVKVPSPSPPPIIRIPASIS